MDRIQARRARLPLRLRMVAVLLLAILFGPHAAPLLQAEAAAKPDCCMAAEGMGCSMHLHRAQQLAHSGHSLAALQPRCPCTPMAPASAGAHPAVTLAASHLCFTLAVEGAIAAQGRSLRTVRAADGTGTRGPPVRNLLA